MGGLLNDLRAAGVITNNALFGAIAQMRYTEPVVTLDADVLVAVPAPDRFDVRAAIYPFCADRGYRAEGEAVRVGAWPVQFVPVISPLTGEAVEQAETADFEGVKLRVIRADRLAVIDAIPEASALVASYPNGAAESGCVVVAAETG